MFDKTSKVIVHEVYARVVFIKSKDKLLLPNIDFKVSILLMQIFCEQDMHDTHCE